LLALLAATALAQAGPITVDGDLLPDWGVTVNDGASNIMSYSGQSGIGLLGWHADDTNDYAGLGGYVDPNFGGQFYDGEILLVAVQGGKLYIGIATGQRPDNDAPGSIVPQQTYSPGDIMITTSAGVFGIEVGGGMAFPPGSDPFPINLDDAGATYVLNNSTGFAVSPYLDPTHNALQTAGSVWSTNAGNWYVDSVGSPFTPTQMIGGSSAGKSDAYIYDYAPLGSRHAIIELEVDLSVFGGGAVYAVDWAPSCGNDLLHVRFEPIPEPGTLALAGFGFVGLIGYRHWRQRKRA
jgi:hypothetical protein